MIGGSLPSYLFESGNLIARGSEGSVYLMPGDFIRKVYERSGDTAYSAHFDNELAFLRDNRESGMVPALIDHVKTNEEGVAEWHIDMEYLRDFIPLTRVSPLPPDILERLRLAHLQLVPSDKYTYRDLINTDNIMYTVATGQIKFIDGGVRVSTGGRRGKRIAAEYFAATVGQQLKLTTY
jgi:hypothetical protein